MENKQVFHGPWTLWKISIVEKYYFSFLSFIHFH